MTSQLSAHFNKVWFPPPSNPSSLLFYVSAYLQTRAHFIRTYQSRSEQRGGLPQSERSVSQPAVQNGDKKREEGRGRQKSFFSENTILQSASLLMVNVKRKKNIHRQLFRKSVLSQRLNAWVPRAFSVLAIPPLHPRLRRGTCKHIS